MMLYTVKFKKTGDYFYTTLKNVKEDDTLVEVMSRVFILQDNSRVEVPIFGTTFMFTKERYDLIKKLQDEEKKKLGVQPL